MIGTVLLILFFVCALFTLAALSQDLYAGLFFAALAALSLFGSITLSHAGI